VARACPRAIQKKGHKKKGRYESAKIVELSGGAAMGKWNDKLTSCRVVEYRLGACTGTAVDGYCGSGLVVR
jgi:hypothetical protein